jgi:RNA polymerase sigma-70 factor (ECF subfamily)
VAGDQVLLGDGARSSMVGAKLKGVNPADIGTFYEREMPRLVLFVALSTSLDIHAAADAAQAAFEKALPRWPTLRNPRAWLYRVAQHEALARSKAARREVPVDVLPDRPDQLSAALAAELRAEEREVVAHLRGLPPKQRQVMTWTLAGFGDTEIAGALGLSTDAVKQSRYYARKNLVKRLGLDGRGSR